MEAKGNTVAGNSMPNSKWPPCISSTKFKWHILTETQRQSQPGEASGQCLSGWKKFQQGCPGCWVCWFETCPKPTSILLFFSLQHLNLSASPSCPHYILFMWASTFPGAVGWARATISSRDRTWTKGLKTPWSHCLRLMDVDSCPGFCSLKELEHLFLAIFVEERCYS